VLILPVWVQPRIAPKRNFKRFLRLNTNGDACCLFCRTDKDGILRLSADVWEQGEGC